MENKELWRKARTFSVEDKHRMIAGFLGGGVTKQQVWQKHIGQAYYQHQISSESQSIIEDLVLSEVLLSSRKLLIERRKRRVVTTDSRHRFRKYPNLIQGATQPIGAWRPT